MKNKILIWGLGLGIGVIVGTLQEHKRMGCILREKIEKYDVSQRYRSVLLEWVGLHKGNESFDVYFKKCGIKNIAVYGNGQIGQKFINDMKYSQTQVSYIIDKKADYMISQVPIKKITDNLSKVDAIVVTVIEGYDDIVEEIKKRYNYQVISIEEVIYGSSEI